MHVTVAAFGWTLNNGMALKPSLLPPPISCSLFRIASLIQLHTQRRQEQNTLEPLRKPFAQTR